MVDTNPIPILTPENIVTIKRALMWIVIHFARHACTRGSSANKVKETAPVIGSCAVADFSSALALGLIILAHGPADPFAEWMSSLMRPDLPGHPCCGPHDQVYVDDYEQDPSGDGFIAHMSGREIHVPSKKIIFDRVNPTGRGVLFLGSNDSIIFCFVPGLGT